MQNAIQNHWPEYVIEFTLLALFMMSACCFGALLGHPSSPVHQVVDGELARRFLMGLAMAATAIALIYSPWGQRSGAHFNPAVTLNFYLLGKVASWDAVFYLVFQFAGGVAGVAAAWLVLGGILDHQNVHYVVTKPHRFAPWIAFVSETAIAAVMMATVLTVSNSRRLAPATGLFSAALVALFITFEAPLSGMSLNPARTFGSAAVAFDFQHVWIYFVAPPLGMFLAARLYSHRRGAHSILCAKLHHHNHYRCIFRCRYATDHL